MKNVSMGWVWRLMSVIPALWETKVGGSPEVPSLRPAWPTWWNPSFTKNTKINWAWWQMPIVPPTWEWEAEWGTKITWTWEADVAMSQDHTTALQPGWQSKTLSQKTNKQTGMQLFLWHTYFFSFERILGSSVVGLLDHMVLLFLVFETSP